MSLVSEFREFAMRGNVIDLAVGVVVGGAFGTIVSSLVNAVIMPVIGVLTSGHDFSELALQLGIDARGTPVLLRYGAFMQSVVNFLIIAAVLFAAIKGINALRKPAPAAAVSPPPPARQEVLLEEIRNLLARSQASAPLAQLVPSQVKAS